jgi:hypothetical protein
MLNLSSLSDRQYSSGVRLTRNWGRPQPAEFVSIAARPARSGLGVISSAGRSDAILTCVEGLPGLRHALSKAIPVAIKRLAENEYLAEFEETGISMTGASLGEAIDALAAEIVETYALYKAEPSLGPEPRRRLQILEGYLGEATSESHSAARG